MENNDIFANITGLTVNCQRDGFMTLDVSMLANDNKIIELFTEAFRGGARNQFSAVKTRESEFLCLWCKTPNPIEHVVCSRCGAPRGYVIGK